MIELLPGFRVAADRVRSQIEDGISTLIIRGEVSDDRIAETLIESAGLIQSCNLLRDEVEAHEGSLSVVTTLVSLLDESDSLKCLTVDGVLETGILEYRRIVADSFNVRSATTWIDFFEEFGRLGPGIHAACRPVFLVSLPFDVLFRGKVPQSTSIVRVLDWRSVFSEADASVAGAHLVSESPGNAIERAMKSSVISAIAGVDFGLADFLGDYGVESFDKIPQLLDRHREQNRENHPYLSDTTFSDSECGGYRLNDGSLARHIHGYGTGRTRQNEIDRRLWHAQIKVLFPFLEAKRRKIIEDNRERFSMPHIRPDGKSVAYVEDLEFGDMTYQLRHRAMGNFDRTIDQIEFLRETRNSLAHFHPVSFQYLVENRRWLD